MTSLKEKEKFRRFYGKYYHKIERELICFITQKREQFLEGLRRKLFALF